MGSGKLPVIECVRSAWQFLLANGRRFVPAAIIVALIAEIGPFIALATGSRDGGSQTVLSASLGQFAIMLPGIVASLMFAAAVLRLAVRNEFIAPTGLAFRADETRLLGVSAGLLCVVLPFVALVYLVMTFGVLARLASTPAELERVLNDPEALSTALETALGPAGSAAFLLFVVFLMVVAAYTATRLFMINAATIGERRIVMFQTWAWSRGNIFRMLLAMIMTWLPATLIEGAIYNVAAGSLNALVTEQNALISIPIFRVATTFVAAMLSIPPIALGAIIYKGLRPADFVAK